MSIDSVFALINIIINSEQGGKITPSRFNTLAPTMQMSFINDRLGNAKKYQPHDPVPNYGYGLNQKTMEELRKLVKPLQTTAVTAGKATYPTDSLYMDTVTLSNGVILTPCSFDEATKLNQSVIKPPTASLPIYAVMSTDIYVYPTSITSILLTYLRAPTTPIWNYTIVNDVPVYAASGGVIGGGTSQDFEVSETAQLEVVNKILAACGVHLDADKVVQYSTAMEAQGA